MRATALIERRCTYSKGIDAELTRETDMCKNGLSQFLALSNRFTSEVSDSLDAEIAGLVKLIPG